MIVLDTNVISEMMLRQPSAAVVRWLDGVVRRSVWVTSITLFELFFGIERLPPGRRRRELAGRLEAAAQTDLRGQVLAFDEAASAHAARLAARAQAAGRPIAVNDAMIAGIVAAHRATLATRNIRHFAGLGIDLVDPWTAAA